MIPEAEPLIQEVRCPAPGCGWRIEVTTVVLTEGYFVQRHKCGRQKCGAHFVVGYLVEFPRPATGRPRHPEVARAITRFVVEHGRRPSIRELALAANCGRGTAERALRRVSGHFRDTPEGVTVEVVGVVERAPGRTERAWRAALEVLQARTVGSLRPMTDDDVELGLVMLRAQARTAPTSEAA